MHLAEYQAMFTVEQTHWWFVARRKFISRVLARHGIIPAPGNTSVLTIADIGAGTGGMISFLRSYGTVTGIEPNSAGRTFAQKRGIRLKKGTAERTGIASGSTDLVCMFDVLYHQGVDDRAALREANRILVPGGMVLITDCAIPVLSGRHDLAVEGRERYTLGEMLDKVRGAGFQPIVSSYMYFLVFPLFAAKRIIDRMWPSHAGTSSDVGTVPSLLNRMLIAINRIESFGMPHISYPWGSSLVVLAKKPGANK